MARRSEPNCIDIVTCSLNPQRADGLAAAAATQTAANTNAKPTRFFVVHRRCIAKHPFLSDNDTLHIATEYVKHTIHKVAQTRYLRGALNLRTMQFMAICGIDEAGRGPWAGPVTAAAVILPAQKRPKGLNDSKVLGAEAREMLALEIRACAIVGVGWASPEEIDQLNILQATFLAMRRAVEALGQPPAAALIDGNAIPSGLPCPAEAIIDGDAHVACISAASIIAKVERDRFMIEACGHYPGYGFSRHKGYGAPEHQKALAELGPCPIHRMSFKPVREAPGR